VARIPYRVPAAEDLPDRVTAVLATVHLLFTEGCSATGPGPALQDERATEALRLARLLRALLPDDAGVRGLLALVLLHSARTPARTAPDGSLVLLAEQDRAQWSRGIHEGVALVGEGLARTPLRPDRYVVQAAIAACHCLARLARHRLGGGRELVRRAGRARPVACRPAQPSRGDRRAGRRRGGPRRTGGAPATGYALLPATRAELLVRLDRTDEAAVALRQALMLPLNDAQRHLLQQRLARL